MDAAKCLREIADKLGIEISRPGDDAGLLTGKILQKIEDGGEYARLCRAMVNQLEAINDCHNEGQDSDETCTLLDTKHGEWKRALHNIELHGSVLPKPPRTP
jgi:hypothetical protein